MEGFLEKKQPPPGFRWQPRWFHLGVDGTLRYFVTALDSDGDQTQELKGVMHLRNVSAIDEAVGHETEFMIEHLEKPKKRQYHLRAETKELRDKWLEKLRENWTPAEQTKADGGAGAGGYRAEDGTWDGDGRSAEARRYKSMRFSDGGTVANNPTFIALQEAWALYGAPGSSLHEFVGRQVDCVVSIGTGDPPPRRVREHMGFKELVWEVLEHHTTSRDTDVVLSQMLPKDAYYRFNAPEIGEIQMDETDKQQLDILQNKVELYLQRPEVQAKMGRLGGLLHEVAERGEPGSARAAAGQRNATRGGGGELVTPVEAAEGEELPSPDIGPSPLPSPTLVGAEEAAVGGGVSRREEAEVRRQAEVRRLLAEAVEAKRHLEARIAELSDTLPPDDSPL